MREPSVHAELATLVAVLRNRGVHVTTRQAIAFGEALAATRGRHVREVALATLTASRAERDVVDAAFADGGRSSSPSAAPARHTALVDDGASEGAASGEGSVTEARGAYSPVEVLRTRDLASCTDEERAALHRHLRRARLEGPPRRSRRWTRAHRRGALDVRSTVRRALRTGGETTRIARRARSTRPRPVVLLLDVSGSMSQYARSMLHLAYAAVHGEGRVEVFTLGTRLTRVTQRLAERDPDRAFSDAVTAAPDWGGGTRLGVNVMELLTGPATRELVRGAVVVVVSDGLDRGEPELLGRGMARLSRRAHRVVWVNPLRASDGYEPAAAGMAAALPHVDDFVDGHSLAALQDLIELVARAPRSYAG